MLSSRGGVWEHSGNPQDPHIHINGACIQKFFRCQQVLSDRQLLCTLAEELIQSAKKQELLCRVDRVVGTNDGPNTLASEVARQLKVSVYDRNCDSQKCGLKLLQVEDFIRSFRKGSATKRMVVVGNHSVSFAPCVLTFLHSPPEFGDTLLDGRTVVPLAYWQNDAWEHPSLCPMCMAGSHRVPPEKIFAGSQA